MQRPDFGAHLAEHVVQLVAVGDACRQRGELGLGRGPVGAMHLGIVEEFAMHHPAVGEHLAPLLLGGDLHGPVAGTQCGLAEFGRRLLAGFDDQHVAGLALGRPAADEHLASITGQREGGDLGQEVGRLMVVLVVDGERDQHSMLVLAALLQQVEALAVGGEPAVIAGFQRHLEQAIGQAAELHRRAGSGFGLLVLVAALLVVLFLVLLAAGLQLVLGQEGEPLTVLQGEGVDLGTAVEIGPHIAVAPRRVVAALESALRQEIEPLAVRREGRRVGVIAVRGQACLGVGGGLVEEQLRAAHGIVGAQEGDMAAVGRPDQRFGILGLADIDQLVVALLDIQHEQFPVAGGMGQQLAVGRQPQMGAPAGGIAGQLLALGSAVGGEAPDLGRIVGFQYRIDPFAVRADHRLAQAILGAGGDVDPAQRAGSHQRDMAERGDGGALAIGGEGGAFEEIERMLDQMLVLLGEVRRQVERDRLVGGRRDVEQIKVGAQLIDDAPLAQAGAAHGEIGVMGQLLAVGAVQLHRP